MARKPNYGFERKERERAKAAKAAERAKAKADKSEKPDVDVEPTKHREDPAGRN